MLAGPIPTLLHPNGSDHNLSDEPEQEQEQEQEQEHEQEHEHNSQQHQRNGRLPLRSLTPEPPSPTPSWLSLPHGRGTPGTRLSFSSLRINSSSGSHGSLGAHGSLGSQGPHGPATHQLLAMGLGHRRQLSRQSISGASAASIASDDTTASSIRSESHMDALAALAATMRYGYLHRSRLPTGSPSADMVYAPQAALPASALPPAIAAVSIGIDSSVTHLRGVAAMMQHDRLTLRGSIFVRFSAAMPALVRVRLRALGQEAVLAHSERSSQKKPRGIFEHYIFLDSQTTIWEPSPEELLQENASRLHEFPFVLHLAGDKCPATVSSEEASVDYRLELLLDVCEDPNVRAAIAASTAASMAASIAASTAANTESAAGSAPQLSTTTNPQQSQQSQLQPFRSRAKSQAASAVSAYSKHITTILACSQNWIVQRIPTLHEMKKFTESIYLTHLQVGCFVSGSRVLIAHEISPSKWIAVTPCRISVYILGTLQAVEIRRMSVTLMERTVLMGRRTSIASHIFTGFKTQERNVQLGEERVIDDATAKTYLSIDLSDLSGIDAINQDTFATHVVVSHYLLIKLDLVKRSSPVPVEVPIFIAFG